MQGTEGGVSTASASKLSKSISSMSIPFVDPAIKEWNNKLT